MSPRPNVLLSVFAPFIVGCSPASPLQQPTTEQRLPSGKTVMVTSCLLAWGADHDQRLPKQDAFALEYVSSLLPFAAEDLDGEVREVFDLIRPISEQWGFSTASVAVFPAAERTGPYVQYSFSRSGTGAWSFVRHQAKVFNTESGRKPE